MSTLTIVGSVYNEAEVLPMFLSELTEQLHRMDVQYEIILVNDGSTDGSKDILARFAEQHRAVKVVNLSRNFGHEAAMTAGVDYATGDCIVCMDTDLQHPPAEIPRMLQAFASGCEIVYMKRLRREDAGFIRRMASKSFYQILNWISDIRIEPDVSDFFLISGRVAEILRANYRERARFLRGVIQQVGFQSGVLEYTAPSRAAGHTKYSFSRLLLFSAIAIASVSQAPLRFSMLAASGFMLISLAVGIYSVIMKLLGSPFSGYTTLVVLVSFGFSVVFLILGIFGEYLGSVFVESKQRPVYIVGEIIDSEALRNPARTILKESRPRP